MVSSSAKTVPAYLESLPADRRRTIAKVRAVIRKNLPAGYRETMNWGMICYEIPLSVYPDTYNKQPLGIAALAAQKNYCALYLISVYGDKKVREWFLKEWKKSGKKLSMGKSCVRFRTADDLPLPLIGKTIAKTPVKECLEIYKRSRHYRGTL